MKEIIRYFFILSLFFACSHPFFAQPAKTVTKSYNGMRIAQKHEQFQVVYIDSTRDSISVTFNVPVNTTSIKKKNILVNNTPLSRFNSLKFNKTGRIIEIKTRLSVGTKFTLELKNIKSYDGKELKTTYFSSLLPWTSTEYPVIKLNKTEDTE